LIVIDYQLTIPDLFLRAWQTHPEQPALWFRVGEAFRSKSWRELAADIARAMGVLEAQGLRAGDRLVQISENRWEWIVLDLACHFLGIVHVPLHASLNGSQLAVFIAHCEAQVVVISNAAQWMKLQQVQEQLPTSLRYLAYENVADQRVQDWSQASAVAVPSPLEPRGVLPETIASIMYTSGTTGDAKGVMLTQRNFAANAQACVEMYGSAPSEMKFNLLPLSHAYARTCDIYIWLVRGSQLALAHSRETLLADLQAVQPTTMNAVPYVYERLWRVLCERRLDQTPNSLRSLLGEKIRTCCAGGASLSAGVLQFYASQNVPLLEGYGLTETSPVMTCSTREHFRPGTCGPLLPDVEVRIAEDGEVLTRSPFVMAGYYKHPQATAEVLRDGWFHTGDLGELSADRFLTIRGRKKELIVLATGKKVVPSVIEQVFANDPLISQMVVVGEGRNYLSALVSLHVGKAAEVSPLETYVQHKLQHCSPHEQVRRIAILPEPLSVERGELTVKLSYCRNVIAQQRAATIDALYAREE
jgi:long-chain acyl-CoA synthetase